MITVTELILAVFVCVAMTIGVIGFTGGAFVAYDMEGQNTTKSMVTAYRTLDDTVTEMKDVFEGQPVTGIGVVDIVFGLASGGWTALKATYDAPTAIKTLAEGLGEDSPFVSDVLSEEVTKEGETVRGINLIDIIYVAVVLIVTFALAAAVFHVFL